MVLTLAIPLRRAYGLHDFITQRHLDNMAKVMLATGLMVAYGYAMELWSHGVRMSPVLLWLIAIVSNVGMWLERFVIIVTSLHRDYLPSSWDMYYPTIWDWATFVGSLGLFMFMMFLFIRFLPMISIFELRELVHHTDDAGPHGPPSATT
jgi:molybdopterin-containing oxidoreductase family membrane subunit